jgi:hypothetical protein
VRGPDVPCQQPGGRDPGVPQILLPMRIRGTLYVGNTQDLGDERAPIYVDRAIKVGTRFIDVRCPRCVTKADIRQDGLDTWVILQHQPGCPELAALAAKARS